MPFKRLKEIYNSNEPLSVAQLLLIGLVMMVFLCIMLIATMKMREAIFPKESPTIPERFELLEKTNTFTVYRDTKENNICYLHSHSSSLSCVPSHKEAP